MTRFYIFVAWMIFPFVLMGQEVVRDVDVSMDAWVNSATRKQNTNFGSKSEIRLKDTSKVGYVQFDVTGVPAGVVKAELHFHSIDYTGSVAVHDVGDDDWNEYSLTWSNRPAYAVSAVGTGAVTSGQYGFVDVTSLVTGNGTHSFALLATGSTKGDLSTREVSKGAFLRLTYSGSNVAPVAEADEYYVYGAEQRDVKYGVLSNDSDPNNDAMTAVLVDGPEHGTLNLRADGTFTYMADAGYEGMDGFTYKARDSHDTGGGVLVSADSNVVNVVLDVRGAGFLMADWKRSKLENDLGLTLGRDEELDLLWALNPISDTDWKAGADVRIAANREVERVVSVRDSGGNFVEGAEVILRQKSRSDFTFGGVLNLHQFAEVNTEDGIYGAAYKAKVPVYFDKVGLMNGLKPKLSKGFEAYLPEFFTWAEGIGMPVRGHLLLWPGGTHMSATVTAIVEQIEESDDDAEIALLKVDLRDAVDAEITDWAKKWDVYEWDVLNEILSNDRIQNIMGEAEMFRWYALAAQHRVNPEARLLLNDFQIISGRNDNRLERFKTKLDYLIGGGAGISAIGFQSRFGWKREDPDEIFRRLNEFNSYDLPLVGTEFEVKSKEGVFYPDELVRARATAEVMSVYFSHAKVDSLFAWDFGLDAERGLIDNNGRAKLNGLVWYYLSRIEYMSRGTQVTDAAGSLTHRGYRGEYDVIVRLGEEEFIGEVSLVNGDAIEVEVPFASADRVSLDVVDDAYGMAEQVDRTTGDWAKMRARVDPFGNYSKESFLKFDARGRVLASEAGVLRIYSETAVSGLEVYGVSDVGWTEESLTWSNKPTMGALLGTVDIAAGEWSEVAVSLPTSAGLMAFGVRAPGDGLIVLGTKEGGFGAELVVSEVVGDLDDDGVNDAFDADDDNDLVPDLYEAQMGLRARVFDPLEMDDDFDGAPTALEFAMGKNPTLLDGGVFEVENLAGGDVILRFGERMRLGEVGGELRVYFSEDLEGWDLLNVGNLGEDLLEWTSALDGDVRVHTVRIRGADGLFFKAEYGAPLVP